MQVGFYHLTRTSVDAALPALLGRTLAAGARAVVLCGSPERVASLDKALWAAPAPDWLPHGTAASGHADAQPIWLTEAEESPNGARYLFLLDSRTAQLAAWDRIFDLFDGADPTALAAARTRWTAAKANGADLTYWKQTETGWSRS